MTRFRLSAEAAADITEIFEYIAKDNIEAAQRVRAEIHEGIKNLARNPGLGHTRHDLTKRELLFWPVYSYLIIYLPKSRPLMIVAVLHGSRDVRKLLRHR